jgi:hypothetical protein
MPFLAPAAPYIAGGLGLLSAAGVGRGKQTTVGGVPGLLGFLSKDPNFSTLFTGMPAGADMQQFQDSILNPFKSLFAETRSQGLAQAKESAGNLTGSGYNNILGQYANQSIAQEQSFLADLLNRRQQQNSGNFLQLLLGQQPAQAAYQPGFTESALGGLSAILPFLGGGAPGQPKGKMVGTRSGAYG